MQEYIYIFFKEPPNCLLHWLTVAECPCCPPPQHWLLFLAVAGLTFLRCYLKDPLGFTSLLWVSSEHIFICCQCVFFAHAFCSFLVELVNGSFELSLYILDISLVGASLADTFLPMAYLFILLLPLLFFFFFFTFKLVLTKSQVIQYLQILWS